MALVVCTGCEGGLLMNPADCRECEGECCYHVDKVREEHIVLLCGCSRCTDEKIREGMGELLRSPNIPH
jgi:hypothetical protein